MYLFKNAFTSIIRNKGRNVLIGIIVLVIASASTITLAIRNTADNVVKNYEEANDIIASISFNRENLMKNFKPGEDSAKENIEKFNDIEQITIDKIKEYGNSNYLKGYYYKYSTSLNSDSLTKATDTFEYEVEDRHTEVKENNNSSSNMPGSEMPGGNGPDMENGGGVNRETTTTITKRTEKFGANRAFSGDFTLNGYSSLDAMEDFKSGTYKISDGEMISDFSKFECVISSELASLNEVKVGDTIKLKNSTINKEYEFKVVGIYKDSSENDDTKNMFSNSANSIITGSDVISTLIAEDSSLVTSTEPSFVLKDKTAIKGFKKELKKKGLNENYEVTTNADDIESATKSIKNVGTFATTFLLIMLIISGVVLLIINMINIRERKYEIGVYRTIGLSKLKLTMQFIIELILVSMIALIIGAAVGGASSKKVGNYLLKNEISQVESTNKKQSENFGRPGDDKGGPKMEFNRGVQIDKIDTIDAIVDYKVIIELLGIGLILTLISSTASMVSIIKFSPLTILKERS